MLKDATLEDITIISLVKESKITRSTFYTYYHDKYELFEDLFLYICINAAEFIQLTNIPADNEQWLALLKTNYTDTLQFLYDHQHVFQQIASKSRLSAIRKGIELSKDEFIYRLEQFNYHPAINKEYVANFFLSGLFMTYELWISNNYDVPIDELSIQLTHLTVAYFNLTI
ncbi:TetR/AcrR family transcriptional regulator [Macrococcus hajekii]|uniref:TetR/AcrR family transcriptional regulator n=1 Tax=Macrococcus hajekii TaxID=198482 RepID=A0A4V3BE82_9STAP|nr:TetR/AcrR family transcriptional regulator [Macrococcus hajekii]TDM01924.1 TetR/AcrR family transcriptional regulator [Macrococcus hajekii]GGB08592.1 hypothetical protein GCM10007190_15740 [Macrococcus hajekii]